MKKFFKKIFGMISVFIVGVESKIYAAQQTSVYGPPPQGENGITRTQTTVYGPPVDPSVSSTISGGQITSIVASILLFIIGLVVILNKKIKKQTKIIVGILVLILITTLILLGIFVF